MGACPSVTHYFRAAAKLPPENRSLLQVVTSVTIFFVAAAKLPRQKRISTTITHAKRLLPFFVGFVFEHDIVHQIQSETYCNHKKHKRQNAVTHDRISGWNSH